MPAINLSETDIENYLNSINMDNYEIFREYKKNNNIFVATNNFFVASHSDSNCDDEKYIKIFGNTNENYRKNNGKYLIYDDINYYESEITQEIKEINLIIIKNLKIELSNNSIDIKKLIKEEEISSYECDELIKDLYFNSINFKKFNLEEKEINENKKYLFKIKKGEINIKNQIEQCQLII